MQLASHGARALKPAGGGAFRHTNSAPSGSRSLHLPSSVSRPSAPASPAQTLFKQTRTFLSRFVAHLTAPGNLRLPPDAAHSARSLYTGAARVPSIQQGLSLPARTALARPLRAPHLPRAPAVPARVTHVGLGVARNFSTARPIFQNLVQNVPVSARAFLEADWDVKMEKERASIRLGRAKAKAEKKAKAAGKERQQPRQTQKAAVIAEQEKEADMDHYFPAPQNEEVTTHLLIPLEPTPTERIPLSVDSPLSPDARPLLPLSLLGTIHAAHSTQALRVSSLFARLDTAGVFQLPGVRCEAHGDASGLCTLLEITFEGWTEARVRSVLGEAGRGWCVLEEVRKEHDEVEKARMEDVLDSMSMSTDGDGGLPLSQHAIEVDPARSLVLPTLDFSATFGTAVDRPHTSSAHYPTFSAVPPSVATPFSDFAFHNAWSVVERDAGSADVHSEMSWSVDDDFGAGSTGQGSISDAWLGVGFSSAFASRVQWEGAPESLF